MRGRVVDKRALANLSNEHKFLIGKRLLRKSFLRLGLGRMKGRVLDAGSGRKPFHGYLEGMDIVTLDYGAKWGPMVMGSCLDLPFKDESFDSIICTEVIEHVPDPSQAVAELQRVLRHGGHIYMTAPMLWCLHYEPHDFFRFTRYGLEHMLRENGFAVKDIAPVGGLFSFLFMRFGEFFYNSLDKFFFFLPRGIRVFAIIPFAWTISSALYAASLLLDPLCKKDVYAWAVVGKKEGHGE